MSHTEFLIIGQGLSGTFLSWRLHNAGRSFKVIDNGNAFASSRIAAGIINPVTGRRIVPTWMIEELLPFALDAYNALGRDIGFNVITQKDIVDFFPSPQMMLAFTGRLKEVPQYLSLARDENDYRQQFKYDFGYGEITPCYTVDLPTLLPAWRAFLKTNHYLIEDDFQESVLAAGEKNIRYQDIIAEHIIFCDGIGSMNNHWFRNLPFALNKGEALIISTEGLSQNKIYKKSVNLVPLKENLFWAGSSYEWNFDDANPSKQFRERIIGQLGSWLTSPFTVEAHLAAVRPATIERRPFVGTHPGNHRIAILNGMGTKGCSLAPYFSNQLVNHLIKGTPVLAEASIERFSRILKL